MLDDSIAFVGGKEYQVRINAAPAPGYAFDNKTEFRINGKLMGNYIGRTANSAGIQARFLAESLVQRTQQAAVLGDISHQIIYRYINEILRIFLNFNNDYVYVS